MKFNCATGLLAEACQNVQRAISGKTTIPALEGIYLKADAAGVLFLTGYDLEVGIQTQIEARVKEPGAVVLNAKVLCEILRKLPGDTIEIECDSRCLARISSGESRFRINGMSAEEYPELPSITGGVPLPVPLGTLREMIRQTIFAVAVNPDTKPIHTGVKFEVSAGELRLAAIDGFRLAVRREPIAYDGDALSFVVPPKALGEILKMSGAEDADVAVAVGRRHIVFDIGSYHMVSRLLDGEFMNYRAAIPAAFKTEAAADTRALIGAIERISLIITEKIKSPIRCGVLPDEGRLEFTCATGVGTARDSVGADIAGEGFEVGFNNRFLLDALRACDTDQVRISFNGAVQPVVILPPEGDAFLFMVLPVRLKND
ncbi:MAG: DNA polymerase III subunit beta [Oscillospiraceae bacterium]|jgi:DNA polymerase-3 subunit beta|nr:DNA polymerase III subunit beta [Oscillospiraceae bacterium]